METRGALPAGGSPSVSEGGRVETPVLSWRTSDGANPIRQFYDEGEASMDEVNRDELEEPLTTDPATTEPSSPAEDAGSVTGPGDEPSGEETPAAASTEEPVTT